MRTVVSFALTAPIPASQYLRQVAPLQALAERNQIRLLDGRQLTDSDFASLPDETILFLQRDFRPWVALLNRPFPTIYDVDDNLLDLPQDHPDFAHYAPLSSILRETLSRFDRVTVSTEPLREQFSAVHGEVRLFPNFLPFLPDVTPKPGQPLRVLLSGTSSHMRDIEFLTPAIQMLAKRLPIEFVFWGFIPPQLKNIRNIGYVEGFERHYPDYLRTLASLQAHIGWIPLSDGPFNAAKSDLKFIEYAACNMMVVASESPSYQSIRHEIDGLRLLNKPQDWTDALGELVMNPSGRLLMAENANLRVRRERMLKDHLELWRDLVEGLPSRVSPQSVTPLPKPEKHFRASIIIPVFNHLELTQNCLDSIAHNTQMADFEVVLVDNASSDGTPEFLKRLSGDVKIIRNEENLGFAKACNQGAKAAAGDYLLFLNNDTVVQPNWLESMVDYLAQHEDVGIVGAKLLYTDGTVQHAGAAMRVDKKFFRHPYKYLPGDYPLVNRTRECDAVTAACFLTPRELFLQLGGFDERYQNGCEDMDYCTNVREHGRKIVYLPAATVTHLESQTPRPKPADGENFVLYLERWGAERMQNEIEFYAEDGFWAESAGTYTPVPNRWLDEWKPQIKAAQERGDEATFKRWLEIVNRIYPVDRFVGRKLTEAIPPVTVSVSQPANPKKILFVCHDFPPYRYAGAQLYALYLAKELVKTGYDVRIFYPVGISARKPGESTRPYEIVESMWEGLPVYQINVDDRQPDPALHPQFCFDNPEIDRAFEQLLRRENFAVVHYHLLYRLSAGLTDTTRRLGTPTAATLHDYWPICATGHLIDTQGRDCSGPESPYKCADCATGFTGNPASSVIDFFARRQPRLQTAYRNIDRVYSPSAYLADAYARFGFDRPQILPLGWLPVHPAHPRTYDGTVVFGFAGQIILRKGLDVLIEALAGIPETNWKLLIWGKSNHPAYFDELLPVIERHPRMSYLGPFAPEDLPNIYSQIDVSVIPSRRENYPLTLLESLSAHVPPVVANVGGVPEMMQDRREGFIFPNGDVNALRSMLRAILQRPEMIDTFRTNIRPVKSIADDAVTWDAIYSELTTTCSNH